MMTNDNTFDNIILKQPQALTLAGWNEALLYDGEQKKSVPPHPTRDNFLTYSPFTHRVFTPLNKNQPYFSHCIL